jgi:hypothetical protein
MKTRLILISKERSNTPRVENTRPISVLPCITKIFEQAIISNIEKFAFGGFLSASQKGFVPECSTMDNLRDVIEEILRVRSEARSVIVFLDLK